MKTYLFKRVDVHYVEVKADSVEQAEDEVRHVSCMEDRVDTEQGEWTIEEEQT
jgi:hypothetical protein